MSDSKSTNSIDLTPPTLSQIERRGNPRRPTFAVFTMRPTESMAMGAGRNISRTGAYFVTSDSMPVEVRLEVDGQELQRKAEVVRVERISPGTVGIAVHFDQPLDSDEWDAIESELAPPRKGS